MTAVAAVGQQLAAKPRYVSGSGGMMIVERTRLRTAPLQVSRGNRRCCKRTNRRGIAEAFDWWEILTCRSVEKNPVHSSTGE